MTDWGKIALLESRLRWHLGKYHFRRDRWEVWKKVGDTAHYWHDKHTREGKKHEAEINWGQILKARAEIAKWAKLMEPELAEVVALRTEIAKLKPKTQEWPMGGWVRPGQPYRVQRLDQGRDFEVPIGQSIVAPGPGQCLQYGHDRSFPGGFGTHAIVRIDAGRFHDMAVKRGVAPTWYAGHAEVILVSPGEHFVAGQPIARLNNSLNEGWGWVELGHYPYGGMGEGATWEPELFKPVWR